MEMTGSIKETRAKIKEWRRQGLSVGLVPTMGYLHEGHKSLIVKAVKENDRVVVSDFVNPIQFGANEEELSILNTYAPNARAGVLSGSGGNVSKRFFDVCGNGAGKRRALWKKQADTFSGRLHRGFKIIPYCQSRQGVFRAKRCAAACSDPPYGA